jgi:hypothetical protein
MACADSPVLRREGREIARSGGLPAVCLPGARFWQVYRE